MHKNILTAILLLVSEPVLSATYMYNFLWVPVNPLNHAEGSPVVVDDYSESSYSTVTINPVGGQNRLVLSECWGKEGPIWGASGQVTAWIVVPEGWKKTTEGVEYNIQFDDSRWIPPYNGSHVPGYTTRISQKNHKWPDTNFAKCMPTGTLFQWNDYEAATKSARMKVYFRRGSMYPGKYNVTIPWYWSYEENKNDGREGKDVAAQAARLTLNHGIPGTISIPVTITSKCDFSAAPLNLTHGTMSGRQANGHQTKPYNLNIKCDTGTSVSVKLKGAHPVSGKTANFTQCGNGGLCELTFNGNKYNETMTVTGNNLALSITSTYHLKNPSSPVAESFEGSGILEIQVL